MEMKPYINLMSLIITIIISCAAKATSVMTSEFELLLPSSFQNSVIDDVWQRLQKEEFNLHWNIGDQTYQTTDVNVLLSGITLDLKTKLQKPGVGNSGPSLILNSRDLSARLNVASIVVDQYIEKEVGGVIGRFRIQARCENVQLEMKKNEGSFRLQLSPVFAGAIVKSQLDDAALTWTPQAWTLAPIVCTGAAGFDDVVRAEILKMTGNADKLTEQKSSLISYAQAELDKNVVDLSKPRIVSASRSDIVASMQLNSLSGGAVGARASGVLRVEFLKSNSERQRNFQLGKQPFDCAKCRDAQIRIPESFAKALAAESFAANSYTKTFLGEEIPGFAQLMHSRVGQLLLWPELLRFLVDDPFRFDVTTSKDLSLRGEKLNYMVSTQLKIKMWAFENEKFIPFMRFEVPVASQVQLSVKSGTALAHFSDVSIQIKYKWEPSYLSGRNSTEKFAAEKISNRASRGLEQKSASYVLPKIELAKGVALEFVGLKALPGTGDVVLSLK